MSPANETVELDRAETYDPRPARNCDVVMKGGVTSGIVYPRAICQLARKSRLRSVGGTSAGAIAAACAAAAELGRNRDGAGFARLAGMHLRLGEMSGGRARLEDLFQPSPSTRVLMALYRALSKPGTRFEKLRGVSSAVFAQSRGWVTGTGVALGTASGLLLSHLLLSHGSLWLGIPFGIFVGLLAGCADAVHALFWRVPRQMFGVCTGKTQVGASRKALIDWLHEELELLAARADSSDPLTFGDLREAKVDLQVVTTCLTHGRPYGLPGLRRTLYFDPDELRKLFPIDVVAYLERVGRELVDKDVDKSERAIEHWFMHPRLPLPRDGDLPVLVAVRMSLSFPILLSAVPLWDYDWGGDGTRTSPGRQRHDAWRRWAKDNPEEWRRLRDQPGSSIPDSLEPLQPERIWFSDGGISSNFPIQLFDTPLPRWPTIGIDLRYHSADTEIEDEGRVQLAQTNGDRIDEDWARMSRAGTNAQAGTVAFLGRVLSSMQNWNDTTLSKVPGYRDRFATVHLTADEGGLNLSMDKKLIRDLGKFGERAGVELAERFVDDVPRAKALNWTSHRWTRLRTTLSVFEEWLAGFQRGAEAEVEPSFHEMVSRGRDEPPTNYRLAAGQRDLIAEVMAKLADLQASLAEDPNLADGAPRPRPTLRVVPRLSFATDEASRDGCAAGVCDVTQDDG